MSPLVSAPPIRRTCPPGKSIYATRDVDVAHTSGGLPRAVGRRLRQPPSSTRRCRGPRCARSTGSSGWSKKWGSGRVDAGVRPGARGRGGRRQPRQPHVGARPGMHGARRRAGRPGRGGRPGPLRTRRVRVLLDEGGGTMSAPTPTVSPELKALMRKLKLGRLIDTLPERLALAKTHGLSHMEFLEQLLLRRGDPPRRRLGRAAGAGRAPRSGHGARGVGRRRQGHLRPRGVVRARLDALRRPSPQRVHPRARRCRQDVHGHRPRPHRLSPPDQRPLRTRREAAQAAEGGTARREPRRRDAQAHRRRSA